MATVRHANGTVVRTDSCNVVSSVTVRERQGPGATPAAPAEPEPEEVREQEEVSASGVWDICVEGECPRPWSPVMLLTLQQAGLS